MRFLLRRYLFPLHCRSLLKSRGRRRGCPSSFTKSFASSSLVVIVTVFAILFIVLIFVFIIVVVVAHGLSSPTLSLSSLTPSLSRLRRFCCRDLHMCPFDRGLWRHVPCHHKCLPPLLSNLTSTPFPSSPPPWPHVSLFPPPPTCLPFTVRLWRDVWRKEHKPKKKYNGWEKKIHHKEGMFQMFA